MVETIVAIINILGETSSMDPLRIRIAGLWNQEVAPGSNFSEPVLSGQFSVLGWELATWTMLNPIPNTPPQAGA